jgi:hypothetical protein
MAQDIDAALEGWDFKPGVVQARLVQTTRGRQVIQMRIDLGVLQLETVDRPDGARPHGFATYFDYLKQQAREAARSGQTFALSEEQCEEADREFVQYYNRRVCWLALRNYARAVADSDHTMAFMDFVRDHSPNDEYKQAHEQFRGFVIFHRTKAAAALAVENENPEGAIDVIRQGLEQMRSFFAAYDAAEHMEEDAMVQQLRKLDRSLRQTHKIDATLEEQLQQAVEREEYEMAAKLRDELRNRRHSQNPG